MQIEQVESTLKPLLPFPFAITSAPDAKFGERIVLLVQTPSPSLSDDEENTIRMACKQLPAYWRPKQTIPVRALPLTGTGKPDRAAARNIARSAEHHPINNQQTAQ